MMRFLWIMLLLPVCGQLWGGTYEKRDGRRVTIKTVGDQVHQRKGHVGPGGNLRWADLSEAKLTQANLQLADLRNANLGNCVLTGADLAGATLRGATLRGANLGAARLQRAELDSADFRGVKNWQSVDWKGAYYTEGTEPLWPKGMDPQRAGVVQKKSVMRIKRL